MFKNIVVNFFSHQNIRDRLYTTAVGCHIMYRKKSEGKKLTPAQRRMVNLAGVKNKERKVLTHDLVTISLDKRREAFFQLHTYIRSGRYGIEKKLLVIYLN